jgi:ubiquinone/menaquinone biosynthesis C-methylase UbiE
MNGQLNDYFKQNWDQMAKDYEKFTNHEGSYSSCIELPTILELLPNLTDKTVLELGCGTGRFSFIFETMKPAHLTGIDLSDEMIGMARTIASDKGSQIQFLQGDIANLSNIPDVSIDFIFASTVLHFIEDLSRVMAEVSRVLKPDGTAIFSVIHPVYSAQYPIAHSDNKLPADDEWKVQYLNKSMRAYVQPWIEFNAEVDDYLCKSYHHTFSDYLEAFIQNDLQLLAMREPTPPEAWKTEQPRKYFSYQKTPTYAIFKLKKASITK